MVQFYGRLYEKQNIVATNCAVQVEVEKMFKLLIENFETYSGQVHNKQVVAQLLPHKTTVNQEPFNICVVLRIVERSLEERLEEQNPNLTGDIKETVGSKETLNRLEKDPSHQEKGT